LPDDVDLAACDVRDRDGLALLFEVLAPLDILVNSATGGERPSGPFLDVDLDAYQGAFDKLWGYTNTVRIGAHHMTENGSIVLVSGAPARRSRVGQSALGSVGGAVEAFCAALAVEIAPRRINVVSPGIISTPMFGSDESKREAMLNKVTSRHLIDRPGKPDEAASAIQFLIENDFVTGTTVDVDGGWLLT
jgi:NAD(P)-dependent dehydrogenase (short-subunit alcohol dehydrogenase family)